MPSRVYSRSSTLTFPFTWTKPTITWLAYENHWDRSPRVAGKLRLRANGLTRLERKVIRYSASKTAGVEYLPRTAQVILPTSVSSQADSVSSAKLRGKLYKGSGALGVTIAGAAQSRNMIVNRYKTLNRSFDEVIAVMATTRNPKVLAGMHLEYIFGWVPLYEDIVAACTTVIQGAVPPVYVSGSHRVRHEIEDKTSYNGVRNRTLGYTEYRVKQVVGVRIQNPNTWLAERAGLLNLATVAWDLVPWSFVVNMFVNVNSLVQQITDYAGLAFENASITRYSETRYVQNVDQYDPNKSAWLSAGQGVYEARHKSRELISAPVPRTLTVKIPELNWELAAMAASLATQKLSRIRS